MSNSAHTYSSAPQEVDLLDLILIFWRRKFLIIFFMIMGVVLGHFASNALQPVYSADALVLMQKDNVQFSLDSTQAIKKALNLDTAYILTQIEVLKSRALAADVIEKLNLKSDPEFAARSSAATARSDPAFDENGFLTLPREVVDVQLSSAVTHFLEKLRVTPVRGSYVVRVTFNSSNPTKAALIANTLVNLYIEQELAEKLEVRKRIVEWLDRRLKNLRDQLYVAEEELAEYSKNFDPQDIEKANASLQQISDLKRQLSAAKTEEAEAQTLLSEAKKRNTDKLAPTFKIAGTSSLLKELKFAQANAQQDLAELSKRYGPKHPQILSKTAEIETINTKIEEERERLQGTLRSNLKLSQTKVRTILQNLDDIKEVRQEKPGDFAQLKRLEQEVETSRLIYKTFLENYRRSANTEGLQEAEASVLSYASIPEEPFFPNTLLIMSLAGVIFTFFGILMAVLLHNLQRKPQAA